MEALTFPIVSPLFSHISNAAFSNHEFYDEGEKSQPGYYNSPTRSSPDYRRDDARWSSYEKEYKSYQPEKYRAYRSPKSVYQEARHSGRQFVPPAKYEEETRYDEYDYNTRRPRYQSKYSGDQQYQHHQHHQQQPPPYKSYNNYRSYGSRLEYRDHEDQEDQEDPSYQSYPSYPSYSPSYKYPSSLQYGSEEKPGELSVIENLKRHLPWPLSMVGRLGEEQASSSYPDSIQSILSVVDPRDQTSSTDFTNHQVLPFLDVEYEEYEDNSVGFSSREDNY